MKIRALSVFEGIVYHCIVIDPTNPCRPTLEVDARTQEGDLDAGPLLVTVADWARMVGDEATVKVCLPELKKRRRLETRRGVLHVRFPTWTDLGEP
jgi:hypothetical protein